jgi:hypothetical protein
VTADQAERLARAFHEAGRRPPFQHLAPEWEAMDDGHRERQTRTAQRVLDAGEVAVLDASGEAEAEAARLRAENAELRRDGQVLAGYILGWSQEQRAMFPTPDARIAAADICAHRIRALDAEAPAVISDPQPWCPNGWAATESSPSCNYTGGHYCVRPPDHEGRCRCDCGATTSRKAPEAQP